MTADIIKFILGIKIFWNKYRKILQYLLPVVLIGMLVVIRLTLFGFIAETPYLYFFLVVILCTWVGEFYAGILTTLISAVVANYFFIPPMGFDLRPTAFFGMAFFIFEGILLTYLIENRRQSVQNLHNSNKRITNILESITDAFISFDKDWHIVYCNPQVHDYFGWKRRDVLGKNIWEKFPETTGGVFYKACHKSMKSGMPHHFEAQSLRSHKWFEVRTYPASEGLNVYITDISDRKDVDKLKDNFISIASHELKTPTTAILAFSQLLKKHLTRSRDSQSKMLANKIETQLKRLINLLNVLLDISKIQNGRLELHPEYFDLNDIVNQQIASVLSSSPHHKIIFKSQLKTRIYGDKFRLGQVLANLLTNAIKYSPIGSKIYVRTNKVGQNIKVEVTDSGVGIPKIEQKKIFDVYYRAQSQKDVVSGFGLGLYISSEIVKSHHGSMKVKSQPGNGSTFYFTLPVVAKSDIATYVKRLNSKKDNPWPQTHL